jgi:S1-C subfamily serine protease
MEPTKPGAPSAKTHSFFQARAVARPGSAAADPPAAPRPRFLKAPFAWMAAHLREMAFVGFGVFAALGFVLIAQVIRPPAKPLTSRDVTRLVDKFLKEKKPEPSFASLAYERVRPSLVLVKGMSVDSAGGDPGFALGTGVVIEDETGLILTALHVVRNATAIRVVFHDGWETDATVVSAQPENDLAVLKPAVIPDDLAPATLAGSGHLNPGDDVVAVGNPFGISNSVSVGVVSGLGRSFRAPQTGETLSNLIQFDAAVNPGNSGGPLLDRNGEVVGIVSALLNPTEQEFFVGIGFAVTIETAASALGLPPW